MKREDIIDELSMRSGIEKYNCELVYDALISTVRDAILDGEEKILLKGLLTINQKTMKERKGKDPVTDKVVTFPESKRITCKISKTIKDEVNGRR